MRDFIFGFETCFFIFCLVWGVKEALSLSQLSTRYNDEVAISAEFQNMFKNVQPKQFRVIESTPALTGLQDREVVIFSSGTSKLMWRSGQELYAVSGSCVTVTR